MKKEAVTNSGAVTYEALQSPKQSFTLGATTYNFANGLYSTDNKEVIEFLDNNIACKRQ